MNLQICNFIYVYNVSTTKVENYIFHFQKITRIFFKFICMITCHIPSNYVTIFIMKNSSRRFFFSIRRIIFSTDTLFTKFCRKKVVPPPPFKNTKKKFNISYVNIKRHLIQKQINILISRHINFSFASCMLVLGVRMEIIILKNIMRL